MIIKLVQYYSLLHQLRYTINTKNDNEFTVDQQESPHFNILRVNQMESKKKKKKMVNVNYRILMYKM